MSEPFIAEVKIFAGNFPPRGWAFCEGQFLPIAQNTALFSIIGTIYGGDGQSTFALPNLRSRAPMHPGRGPGLTPRRIGERDGAAAQQLTLSELGSHRHTPFASSIAADTSTPDANTISTSEAGKRFGPAVNLQPMSTEAVSSTGGGQPHSNMQPYLGVYFIIALVGLFPS